jgi:hypothetical protein
MDATIIYLKDGKNGKVEVVMELIGEPSQSFLIGNAIVNNLWEVNNCVFVKNNEFTQDSPSDRLQ